MLSAIALWSYDICDENKLHVPSSCQDLVYFAVVNSSPVSVKETAAICKQAAGIHEIKAVICGGEHGVARTLQKQYIILVFETIVLRYLSCYYFPLRLLLLIL
jgi:hypothetical protein